MNQYIQGQGVGCVVGEPVHTGEGGGAWGGVYGGCMNQHIHM